MKFLTIFLCPNFAITLITIDASLIQHNMLSQFLTSPIVSGIDVVAAASTAPDFSYVNNFKVIALLKTSELYNLNFGVLLHQFNQ